MQNINLPDWCEQNPIDDDLIWKNRAKRQFYFMIHYVSSLLWDGEYFEFQNEIKVVSTHMSKSILLPVYNIAREDLGINFHMRNNFFDWKISVDSKKEIDVDFNQLFNLKKEYPSVYFEGFKDDYIYGSYSKNKKQWSTEISDDYRLWTTMFLICKFLKSTVT